MGNLELCEKTKRASRISLTLFFFSCCAFIFQCVCVKAEEKLHNNNKLCTGSGEEQLHPSMGRIR